MLCVVFITGNTADKRVLVTGIKSEAVAAAGGWKPEMAYNLPMIF